MTAARSPVVVDAHTHAFPPEWVRDRTPLLAADEWFAALYGVPSARMIDGGELLAAMDDAGVMQAVICGWPWSDPGLCRAHNDYLAAVSEASGGRLAWLATVAPAAPGAAAEAGRALALGAAGIGELNADAQGFDLEQPATLEAIGQVLIDAGAPLMVHASEPVGHDYPGKGTATPDRMLHFLRGHPDLTMVLAHWGGGLPFYELMPEVAIAAKNVVYDSAASSYLYRPAVFRAVLDIVGPERVLWASDHPVLTMRRFLARTGRDATLRPEEEAAVMAGNARRVYRLPDIETRQAGTES
ncbi:MAG: amidohydrolase family protein [Thermomicrobiales bacterium]